MIPVIDLKDSQVVRAIAGHRDQYQPIHSPLVRSADPAHVAETFVEKFASDTIYVADLDAIQRQTFSVTALRKILATGVRVWLDAGLRNAADLRAFTTQIDCSPSALSMIFGLESIQNLAACSDLLSLVDRRQAIFSLDLRQSRPLANSEWNQATPDQIVAEVYALGIRRCIVLDLARVGVASGTGTIDLCRNLHQQFPDMELFAGGGVRGLTDLQDLHKAGCQGALVATALHDGGLTAADVQTAASWNIC